MYLTGGFDHARIIVVHELSVSQRGEQLKIEGGDAGSFLNRFLRRGKVLERQFGATQIQKRTGQMIVERDGLGELGASLLGLAQTEVGRAQRVVRRDETGINGSGGYQVLQGALVVFAHQQLIALFVLTPGFARSLEVKLRERAVGTFQRTMILTVHQPEILIHINRLERPVRH
jgi:hypothetical protein